MARSQLLVYLFRAISMLIAIPAHEAAHALASLMQGDPTAKNRGRLTLNPFAHFDLWGCLCLVFIGVGWAKPVPVNASRYKNPKRGMILTALAGPFANLLLAYLAIVLYKIVWYVAPGTVVWQFIATLLMYLASIDIALAAFNLLPLPPFDGSRLFTAFLPTRLYFKLMEYSRYILVAVFILVFLGALSGPLSAVQNFMWDILDQSSRFVDTIFYPIVSGTAI